MLNIRAYLFGNVGIALASLRLIYDLVYFIEVCLVLLEHFKGWAVFFFKITMASFGRQDGKCMPNCRNIGCCGNRTKRPLVMCVLESIFSV